MFNISSVLICNYMNIFHFNLMLFVEKEEYYASCVAIPSPLFAFLCSDEVAQYTDLYMQILVFGWERSLDLLYDSL